MGASQSYRLTSRDKAKERRRLKLQRSRTDDELSDMNETSYEGGATDGDEEDEEEDDDNGSITRREKSRNKTTKKKKKKSMFSTSTAESESSFGSGDLVYRRTVVSVVNTYDMAGNPTSTLPAEITIVNLQSSSPNSSSNQNYQLSKKLSDHSLLSSNTFGSLLGGTLLTEDPDNEDDSEYELGATKIIEEEEQDYKLSSTTNAGGGSRKIKQGNQSPVIQYQQKYQHGSCYVLIKIGAGSKCRFGSGYNMIGIHIQSPKLTTILSLKQMIAKYIIYPKIDNIQNDIVFTISSNGERDGERIIVKNDDSISETQLFDVSLSWRLIRIWHTDDIHPSSSSSLHVEIKENQHLATMQDQQHHAYHNERSTITVKTDSGLVFELLVYLDESICTLKKIIHDELGIHPRDQILLLLQQHQQSQEEIKLIDDGISMIAAGVMPFSIIKVNQNINAKHSFSLSRSSYSPLSLMSEYEHENTHTGSNHSIHYTDEEDEGDILQKIMKINNLGYDWMHAVAELMILTHLARMKSSNTAPRSRTNTNISLSSPQTAASSAVGTNATNPNKDAIVKVSNDISKRSLRSLRLRMFSSSSSDKSDQSHKSSASLASQTTPVKAISTKIMENEGYVTVFGPSTVPNGFTFDVNIYFFSPDLSNSISAESSITTTNTSNDNNNNSIGLGPVFMDGSIRVTLAAPRSSFRIISNNSSNNNGNNSAITATKRESGIYVASFSLYCLNKCRPGIHKCKALVEVYGEPCAVLNFDIAVDSLLNVINKTSKNDDNVRDINTTSGSHNINKWECKEIWMPIELPSLLTILAPPRELEPLPVDNCFATIISSPYFNKQPYHEVADAKGAPSSASPSRAKNGNINSSSNTITRGIAASPHSSPSNLGSISPKPNRNASIRSQMDMMQHQSTASSLYSLSSSSFDIFISFRSEDFLIVSKIKRELEIKYGYRICLSNSTQTLQTGSTHQYTQRSSISKVKGSRKGSTLSNASTSTMNSRGSANLSPLLGGSSLKLNTMSKSQNKGNDSKKILNGNKTPTSPIIISKSTSQLSQSVLPGSIVKTIRDTPIFITFISGKGNGSTGCSTLGQIKKSVLNGVKDVTHEEMSIALKEWRNRSECVNDNIEFDANRNNSNATGTVSLPGKHVVGIYCDDVDVKKELSHLPKDIEDLNEVPLFGIANKDASAWSVSLPSQTNNSNNKSVEKPGNSNYSINSKLIDAKIRFENILDDVHKSIQMYALKISRARKEKMKKKLLSRWKRYISNEHLQQKEMIRNMRMESWDLYLGNAASMMAVGKDNNNYGINSLDIIRRVYDEAGVDEAYALIKGGLEIKSDVNGLRLIDEMTSELMIGMDAGDDTNNSKSSNKQEEKERFRDQPNKISSVTVSTNPSNRDSGVGMDKSTTSIEIKKKMVHHLLHLSRKIIGYHANAITPTLMNVATSSLYSSLIEKMGIMTTNSKEKKDHLCEYANMELNNYSRLNGVHPNVALAYYQVSKQLRDVDVELSLSYLDKSIDTWQKCLGVKNIFCINMKIRYAIELFNMSDDEDDKKRAINTLSLILNEIKSQQQLHQPTLKSSSSSSYDQDISCSLLSASSTCPAMPSTMIKKTEMILNDMLKQLIEGSDKASQSSSINQDMHDVIASTLDHEIEQLKPSNDPYKDDDLSFPSIVQEKNPSKITFNLVEHQDSSQSTMYPRPEPLSPSRS